MEEQLFIPMGMRKDFNKELTTQEDSQYLYDAHNIRVITRGDETTGSIINERGTRLVSNAIYGAYMGHAIINDKIVLFTHDDANTQIESPSKASAIIVEQGTDDTHLFYKWTLEGLAAKTFSGTMSLRIYEILEENSINILWSKTFTKEEILENFLDKPIKFTIGILEGTYNNIKFEVTLSDSGYEFSEPSATYNGTEFTVDIKSSITYKTDNVERNIPVIINNKLQNGWEKFFSGGTIVLTRQGFDPIYQKIPLSYDSTKPTIYWFNNLEIDESQSLKIDVLLNYPSGSFLTRELIPIQENSPYYGIVCNIITHKNIGAENTSNNKQIKDRIYLINDDGSINKLLFKGDLGFSFDYPIEAVPYYEGIKIQKVYWTDGLNPTRVINIARTIDPTDNTQFDFVPTLKLEETVQIYKVDASSEGRAPGVVQYILTYVNKFLQESNPFFVSSLYYTSFSDRAGSPEDIVYSALS